MSSSRTNSLRMDPGIVTSELSKPIAMDAAPETPLDMPVSPTAVTPKRASAIISPAFITCRTCRSQIMVDDIEKHECKNASSPSKAAVTGAARRASSFLETFLDDAPAPVSPPPKPKPVEPDQQWSDVYVYEAPPPPPKQQLPVYDDVVIRDAEVTHYHHPSFGHHYSMPQMIPTSPTASTIRPPTTLDYTPSSSARLSRSASMTGASPLTTPSSSPTKANALINAPRSLSSPEAASPIQCRVRGVRVTKDNVAMYSIISSILQNHLTGNTSPSHHGNQGHEVVVERRYREFYAFALNVYAMFPSDELWQRLPPKTFCLSSHHLSDGFLLRRKHGLDDFIRKAIEMMDLGSSAQGTIGQWYLVRKFLNLPPQLIVNPTKDRSLVAAMQELKKHARQTSGWTLYSQSSDLHDATYEKVCDGFHMVKRVHNCHFPARAVFDMITKGSVGVNNLSSSSTNVLNDAMVENERLMENENFSQAYNNTTKKADWYPHIEKEEIYRRENGHTWTERTIYKGRWGLTKSMEMISIKSWKVDENGSIVIVMIPADDAEFRNPNRHGYGLFNRVDCVLGGWVITPTPQEETCTVTWIMQANFGECDPQNEFTGSQGLTSFIARNFLLSWAEEIPYLLTALQPQYDPVYYRNLGPLLSGNEFQKLQLNRSDTMSSRVREDPRVYILAQELEPCMCLFIHKNTNKNVLIFKTNHKTKLDLDVQTPLRAEWIMFEKQGNPRTDLSTIERNTTYDFSIKQIGTNVYHFTLDLLRRDCVLRYDPLYGYGLFTTINGKPNMLLKRIYLQYAKTSRLSFSRIDEITLVGDSDMEVMTLK